MVARQPGPRRRITHATRTPFGCIRSWCSGPAGRLAEAIGSGRIDDATACMDGHSKRIGSAPTAFATYPSFVQVRLQWFAGCENGPRITRGTGEESRTGNEQCEVLRSGRRPRYWSYCKASRDIGTCCWSKWLGSSWLGALGPCRGRRRGVIRPESHEQRGRRTASGGGFRQVRDSQREVPKGQMSPLPTCTGGASELIDFRVRAVQCKAETQGWANRAHLAVRRSQYFEVPCGGTDPGCKPDAPGYWTPPPQLDYRGNCDPW
jgi:hypothetical protein